MKRLHMDLILYIKQNKTKPKQNETKQKNYQWLNIFIGKKKKRKKNISKFNNCMLSNKKIVTYSA